LRIALLFPDRRADEIDAIRDHGVALAAALGDIEGVSATLVSPSRLDEAAGAHVVVQYNPFSYGRWGFAPGLVAQLARRRRGFASLAVMVHEPYVPVADARSLAMGGWQRAQLVALLALADRAFTSTDGFRTRLRRITRTPIATLPVGSNLPDRRADRSRVRSELGVAEDDVVIALFGTGHPSRLTGLAARAITGLEVPVTVLNLGAGAPALDGLPASARVVTPGSLPAPRLATMLAAGDLALMPFVDGVTTRRSSVVAVLQHGLAVVTTRSSVTEPIFADALALAPVGDEAAFVRATTSLVTDRAERDRLRAHARSLYEREFAWPVNARRLVDALGQQQSS
jgi:glycosyltransferase involved in cell wall biosynthesis